LDVDGAQRLATYLVDQGNEGLVVSGTTGESPTTSDSEKDAVLRAVLEAVGDRAFVVAGVGSNDTRHTIELAQHAEKAGAHGVLVVTPYYNKPPQSGLLQHFTAVADATGLPMVMYDIPHRAGVPIETDTLIALAAHPRIVAVKDAKGDPTASGRVMAASDLVYYSGDDILTLPLMAVGAVGVIGVATHVATPRIAAMVAGFTAGDVAGARRLHQELIPVFVGMFRTQGAILAKAALNHLGLPAGPMRLPLPDATPEQVAQLVRDLAEGRVEGFTA
jgi:4-hydroxy-tetrahydrodipicolinate synthase